MALYFLLLFLMFSSPALAEDATDRLMQKPIVKEMMALLAEADGQPPACEPFHRMVTLTENLATPATCPTSAAFYELVIKMTEGYADGCKEYRRQVDKLLGGELTCQERSPLWEIQHERLNAIRKSYGARGELLEDQKFITYNEPWLGDAELGTGEFAREECILPALLSLQLRKKISTLASHQTGELDNQVYEACAGPEPLATLSPKAR